VRRDSQVEDDSDEIRREDGLERYWLFYNGEWAETIFGLAAAIGLVFWCFLYILGYANTLPGYILLGVAAVGFIGWRFLFDSLSERERSGWKKGKSRSPRLERREAKIAAALWLFIFASISIILLLQWRHGHHAL
jgi:hypothetical protein